MDEMLVKATLYKECQERLSSLAIDAVTLVPLLDLEQVLDLEKRFHAVADAIKTAREKL